LVPEIVLSLTQLVGGSLENIDAKLAVAKERTQNLQEIITGLAPSTGGLPDADSDKIPEPLADQEASPEEEKV
jgi:ribosomal protein L12E/L44/L45/RPP1/RPP2